MNQINRVIPPLQTLYLYVSGSCNLRCRHCWISPKERSDELGFDEVKDVVRQAKELGAISVKLTGGEPFVRKDIMDIIRYIRGCDLGVVLESNGTLIDAEKAEELKALSIDFISLSLDSSLAAAHDEFRGGKGAFEATLNGMAALRRAGLSFQIISSIYKANIAELEDLISLAGRVGAHSLKLNPITSIGRGVSLKNEGCLIDLEDLVKLERHIERELQAQTAIPILLDIPYAFKSLKYIRERRGSCCILNIIGVLSNGIVSLCGIGEEIKELNMGSVKETPLRTIWEESPTLKELRETVPAKLEGVCALCVWKKICLGKCRAQAFVSSNSLTAPFDFCQEAYEKGLFPEGRINRKKETVYEEALSCTQNN